MSRRKPISKAYRSRVKARANSLKGAAVKKSYYNTNLKVVRDVYAKVDANARSAQYRAYKTDSYFIITELDKFVEEEMYELADLRTKQTGFNWEVDHIQPLSKGGNHSIANLQVTTRAWNRAKNNRNSDAFPYLLTYNLWQKVDRVKEVATNV